MYYEAFAKLCEQKKVRPADVSRATGISTATLTSWKKGKYTPKTEKLQLIADYFGVPLETFTDKKKRLVAVFNKSATDAIAKKPIEPSSLFYNKEKIIEDVMKGLAESLPQGHPVYYEDEETARLAQEALENPDLRMLMDASRGLSPEDIRAIIVIAKRMKGTNPDG